MSEGIAAKKATACVSDRVYVSNPDETVVVYVDDNKDGEGYVGWLARIAFDDEAQEDCGALELANGEFVVYANNTDRLTLELERSARRLGFGFAQIIDLTQNPIVWDITDL